MYLYSNLIPSFQKYVTGYQKLQLLLNCFLAVAFTKLKSNKLTATLKLAKRILIF